MRPSSCNKSLLIERLTEGLRCRLAATEIVFHMPPTFGCTARSGLNLTAELKRATRVLVTSQT